MWVVVWLIAAKLQPDHPGHFNPYPLLTTTFEFCCIPFYFIHVHFALSVVLWPVRVWPVQPHRPAIQLSKQHHCGLRKKAYGVGAAPLKARQEMNLLVN